MDDNRLEFISIKALSKLLNMSPSTIRGWIYKCHIKPGHDPIPFYKINGAVRFDLREIKVWLERRKVRFPTYLPLALLLFNPFQAYATPFETQALSNRSLAVHRPSQSFSTLLRSYLKIPAAIALSATLLTGEVISQTQDNRGKSKVTEEVNGIWMRDTLMPSVNKFFQNAHKNAILHGRGYDTWDVEHWIDLYIHPMNQEFSLNDNRPHREINLIYVDELYQIWDRIIDEVLLPIGYMAYPSKDSIRVGHVRKRFYDKNSFGKSVIIVEPLPNTDITPYSTSKYEIVIQKYKSPENPRPRYFPPGLTDQLNYQRTPHFQFVSNVHESEDVMSKAVLVFDSTGRSGGIAINIEGKQYVLSTLHAVVDDVHTSPLNQVRNLSVRGSKRGSIAWIVWPELKNHKWNGVDLAILALDRPVSDSVFTLDDLSDREIKVLKDASMVNPRTEKARIAPSAIHAGRDAYWFFEKDFADGESGSIVYVLDENGKPMIEGLTSRNAEIKLPDGKSLKGGLAMTSTAIKEFVVGFRPTLVTGLQKKTNLQLRYQRRLLQAS